MTESKRPSPPPWRVFGLFARFILIAAHSTTAFAASAADLPPLVRADSVSGDEASAFANANQRPLLSALKDNVALESIDHLSRLLERAQEAWLAGSMVSARALFLQITALALSEDWREPERETIGYAFMRLAQSASTPIECDRTLKAFVTFDPAASVDASLFPPPLMAKLGESKVELAHDSERVNLKSIFADASFIRLNGRKWEMEADPAVMLPSGTYRVSIYSDLFPKQSQLLTRKQLIEFDERHTAAVTGSCENPKLVSSQLFNGEKFDALFASGCLRTNSHGQWLPVGPSASIDRPQSDQTLAESDHVPSQLPSEWLPHPEDRSMTAAEIQTQSVWEEKKTWIWVGVTALALGAAYAIYQNQHAGNSSPRPTQGNIQ